MCGKREKRIWTVFFKADVGGMEPDHKDERGGQQKGIKLNQAIVIRHIQEINNTRHF